MSEVTNYGKQIIGKHIYRANGDLNLDGSANILDAVTLVNQILGN